MRVSRFEVQSFRNLRHLTIPDAKTGITAIIGANGSGKSNILEIIMRILMDIYFGKVPQLDFVLEYETQGRSVQLRGKDAHLSIRVDGQPMSLRRFKTRLRDGPAQTYFPERVVVYYSGECKRLAHQIQRYRRHFVRECQQAGKGDYAPLFVAVTNEDARAMLLALVAHDHQAMLRMLGILSVSDVRIHVRSPQEFDSARDEPMLWGTTGALRAVLAAFENASTQQNVRRKGRDKGEALFAEERTYLFSVGEANKALRDLGRELVQSGLTVYSALELIESRNLLIDLSFNVATHYFREAFPFEYLSEGEKQLLAVLGCLRLSGHRHLLALLDEPDTHLNPGWAWEYTHLLAESLTKQQGMSSTILLTTHDPVLISGLAREQVLVARQEGNQSFLEHPEHDLRGQGVGNLLANKELFALPSSLDKATQVLMDERLALSVKEFLSPTDKKRLAMLDKELNYILPGVNARDPELVEFLRAKYSRGD